MSDDYSFLQEKIKDEAGSPKMLRKKIIRMILLGFIFGIVACFTFFMLEPWIQELLGQEKEEISIPKDEITEESVEEQDGKTEEDTQIRLLKSLQNAVKEISPAVVAVNGYNSLDEKDIKSTSGVIIADNGSELLIMSQTLTDKTMKNIYMRFLDGNEYEATLKMQDNNLELSIWAVDKSEIESDTLRKLEKTKLGNSLLVETGDPAIILAAGQEERLKVSYGFVASSKEKIAVTDGAISILRADMAGASYTDGMLFNQDGEMIGIANSENSDSNMLITFYSISDIKNEIERMSNDKAVPYIGIRGVELPEELKETGEETGIWVEDIEADSPAMAAGVQCGDIIVKVGDADISNMKEYRNALLKENVKNTLILTGLRKGTDDSYVEMEFKTVVGKK